MKNLLRAVLLSLICSAFLISCTNIAETDKQPESYISNVLTINATIDDGSSALTSSGRSIVSTSVDAQSLYYYLVAKNLYTSNYILPSNYLTFESISGSTNKGAISCDEYPASNYEFTLYALNTPVQNIDVSIIRSNAVLSGTINVDTRTTFNLSFVLTPKDLLGTGSVLLKLYTASNWTFDNTKYLCHAQIKKDGILYGTDEPVEVSTLPTGTPPDNYQYISTLAGGLPSGIYDFEVTFTLRKDVSKKYSYKTNLFVLPNVNLIQSVAIPDVIEYAPNPPSQLKASYKAPTNINSLYYDVNFTWNDNSNNELYFSLDIQEIVPRAEYSKIQPSTYEWTSNYISDLYSSSYRETYEKSVESSSRYISGTLMHSANSTGSLTLKFELGKRYVARICAVNDAGKSDYTYLDLSAGATGTPGFVRFATTAKTINLFSLTYELAGGTLYYADGNTESNYLIYYYTQTDYGAPIISLTETPNLMAIEKDGRPFTTWTTDTVGGTVYGSVIYSDCKNLTLFANY